MAKFSEWLQGMEYELLHGNPGIIEVSELAYDSRRAAPEAVFVCMRGANTDSHSFLPEILEKGTQAIVVEAEASMLPIDLDEIYEGIAVVRVASSREALALLSAARFGYPAREMTVIAVTGTKGKTTTAHMIRSVLEASGHKVGMIGTTGVEYAGLHEDSRNTTPESYELHHYFRKMADSGCDMLVMEASSQGFKLHRTAGILFDYGIFTNIESDHIGPNEHKDFEEYKQCKAMIFRQSRQGILNVDAEYAEELRSGADCPILGYGIERQADFRASGIAPLTTEEFVGTEFSVSGRTELSIQLNLPGKYNVYNALAALSVCSLIGIPEESLRDAFRRIHVNGRTEIAFKNDDMLVLVDYAHNAMSMENLLTTLREYHPKRLVLVFGCGGNRAKDRRYGMGKAAARFADLSILTADNSRFERTEDIISDIKETLVPAGGRCIEIPDRGEAIEYAMKTAEPGDIIAVIGKGHEDYNEVNGVRTHFSDREAVLAAAERLGLLRSESGGKEENAAPRREEG